MRTKTEEDAWKLNGPIETGQVRLRRRQGHLFVSGQLHLDAPERHGRLLNLGGGEVTHRAGGVEHHMGRGGREWAMSPTWRAIGTVVPAFVETALDTRLITQGQRAKTPETKRDQGRLSASPGRTAEKESLGSNRGEEHPLDDPLCPP